MQQKKILQQNIHSNSPAFGYPNLAAIYLLKANNKNTRTGREICSKLPERRQWRRFGIFVVNFEHFPHLLLVFLLLTLNM